MKRHAAYHLVSALIFTCTLAACGHATSEEADTPPGFSSACRIAARYASPLKTTSIVGPAGTFGALRWTGSNWTVHTGADLEAAVGTPVFAISPGKVVTVGDHGRYGLTIVIDGGYVESLYAHLKSTSAFVKPGAVIEKAGEQIALSGISGNAAESTERAHLHLELAIGSLLNGAGQIIHDNVVNPCSRPGSVGNALLSVVGNVKATGATLDGKLLPSRSRNTFIVSNWPVGVPNTNRANNLTHVLAVRTAALCAGTYAIVITPGAAGGAVFQRNPPSDALIRAGFRNGQTGIATLVVYQNPGIHTSALTAPHPTSAPAC